MNAKHSTAPAVEKKPLDARQAVGLQLEAILTGLFALLLAAAIVVFALQYDGRLLFALPVAALVYLRAHLLWREVHSGPSLPHRLWWRYVAWRTARAMRAKVRPKPYREVKVPQGDPVRIPRQPQEMAREKETAIVHGYTSSDVYWIACRASTYGLGERATDEYNRRIWTWDEANKISLPSGRHLSRTGFRAVQDWLVGHKLAVSQPAYQLTVTPEAVATELEKER